MASTSVRNVWRFVAVMLILLGLAQRALAEVPADFDEFVKKTMKDYNVPGMSVAVVDNGKVFAKGYGVRNVDKPGAVDADTIFMLASNSKAFTSALLAIMVDRKKIQWDDHVIDYLPGFELKDMYATRNCTPRDLLAHRSGLPALTGDNLEALGFTRLESMYKFRFIEPGCTFRDKANYSNPGFVCAGELAAKLGGDSYENLIRKELFKPLNMTRSGATSKDFAGDANVADAHMPLPKGGSKVIPWDSSDTFGPAGALTSTANDLAKWMQLQLNDGSYEGHQIISADNIREMHRPAMVSELTLGEMPPISDHCGFSFGLGWGAFQYQGYPVVEKTGGRAGMRSVVDLVPAKKIGIAVLANQNMTVATEAVRAYLLDKMVAPYPGDVQAEVMEKQRMVDKFFAVNTDYKPNSKPTLPLQSYAGEYENALYGKVRVLVEGDQLRWEAGPEKVSGPLTHVGYNTFMLAWPPGRISIPEEATFVIGADGIPTSFNTESFDVLTRVKQGSKN